MQHTSYAYSLNKRESNAEKGETISLRSGPVLVKYFNFVRDINLSAFEYTLIGWVDINILAIL